MQPAYNPLSAALKAALLAASIFTCLAPIAFAASDVPNPTVTPIAYDSGSKHHPFIAASLNLPAMGYVENEFQMSGTANVYAEDGAWTNDGKWSIKVAQADVPYATRMLVRRPVDPAKFNGTVVIEWLNNTAFMDVDVIWGQSHTELIRDGFVWIGISAQSVGVNMLKSWDSQRYGALQQGDDSLSYDIFSQAAQAVRSQSALVLGGLPLKYVIGGGESQSAMRLVTYVNAFQTSATQVYDSILIYSRLSLVAPLNNGLQMDFPLAPHIRADNAIKVMQLETEEDTALFEFHLARQDDTELLRTWEVAGASHYDDYGVSNLLPQYLRDLPNVASIPLACKNSFNQLPFRYIVNGALVALTRWMETGQAPSHSPRIEFTAGQVVRDAYGNAKGGIRMPEMEAATATNNFDNGYSGVGNAVIGTLACPFLGNTVPFDDATLKALYPTHRTYISKFASAAKAALKTGYLLQADYDDAIAHAKVAQVPKPD